MTTQTYQEASWTLLAQAEEELAQGDIRQASEKAWGAAAQIVKAVAQQRGWPHQRHAALFPVIASLAEETGDDQLRNLFQVANSLHTNFYKNWDTADNVSAALADVRLLVDKLAPLA